MLFLPCLLAEDRLDVVGEVEFQWVSEVGIEHFDLIEQRIQDEGHIVEHALLASLVALSPVERVELDPQLGWRVRAEVVDLDLLRDEIAVVSALQLAGVELDGPAHDHVLLGEADLELFVKQVHKRKSAVYFVDRKGLAEGSSRF